MHWHGIWSQAKTREDTHIGSSFPYFSHVFPTLFPIRLALDHTTPSSASRQQILHSLVLFCLGGGIGKVSGVEFQIWLCQLFGTTSCIVGVSKLSTDQNSQIASSIFCLQSSGWQRLLVLNEHRWKLRAGRERGQRTLTTIGGSPSLSLSHSDLDCLSSLLVLKSYWASESLRELVKTQIAAPFPSLEFQIWGRWGRRFQAMLMLQVQEHTLRTTDLVRFTLKPRIFV